MTAPNAHKRCWFHRWKHIEFVGIADLHIRERCAKCGRERFYRVGP